MLTWPCLYIRKQQGVTLVEYGLVGASLVVVGIAGLALLGKNANLALENFEKGLHPKPAIALASSSETSGGGAASSSSSGSEGGETGGGGTPTSSTPSTSVGQTEKACFKNGLCINVPVVSSQTLDDTSGSMGSQLTSQFADTIMGIAEALKEQPNADSRLVELITTLANSGHSLGDTEGLAVSECPPGTQCTGNQTTLRNSLSLVISKDSIFSSDLQTLNGYVQNNPNAISPELMKIIQLEAGQITEIAQAYRGQPNPSEDGSYIQWSFSKNVEITHQSANAICGTGGNSQCVR